MDTPHGGVKDPRAGVGMHATPRHGLGSLLPRGAEQQSDIVREIQANRICNALMSTALALTRHAYQQGLDQSSVISVQLKPITDHGLPTTEIHRNREIENLYSTLFLAQPNIGP